MNALEFMDAVASAVHQGVRLSHTVQDPDKLITDPERYVVHELHLTEKVLADILKKQFTDVRLDLRDGLFLNDEMRPLFDLATAWLRDSRMRELELGETRRERDILKQRLSQTETLYRGSAVIASKRSRELDNMRTFNILGWKFRIGRIDKG